MQDGAENHFGATACVAQDRWGRGKDDGCFEKGVKGGRMQYNKACNSRTNHWT